MAEGGYENPAYDPNVDPDDWHDYGDDNDDDEQNLNETIPFVPSGSSAPWPPGEEIQMQTMQHEQSGLPDMSYTETSFGGGRLRNVSDNEIERRLNASRNPTTGLLDT